MSNINTLIEECNNSKEFTKIQIDEAFQKGSDDGFGKGYVRGMDDFFKEKNEAVKEAQKESYKQGFTDCKEIVIELLLSREMLYCEECEGEFLNQSIDNVEKLDAKNVGKYKSFIELSNTIINFRNEIEELHSDLLCNHGFNWKYFNKIKVNIYDSLFYKNIDFLNGKKKREY